jgi:hypothetical protein
VGALTSVAAQVAGTLGQITGSVPSLVGGLTASPTTLVGGLTAPIAELTGAAISPVTTALGQVNTLSSTAARPIGSLSMSLGQPVALTGLSSLAGQLVASAATSLGANFGLLASRAISTLNPFALGSGPIEGVGGLSSGAGSGLSLLAMLAAISGLLLLTWRRLCDLPRRWRPFAFVAILERPG